VEKCSVQPTSTTTRSRYQPHAPHTVCGSLADPQRGQRLRGGASSCQELARRLRVFDFDVFFFGTAIVRFPRPGDRSPTGSRSDRVRVAGSAHPCHKGRITLSAPTPDRIRCARSVSVDHRPAVFSGEVERGVQRWRSVGVERQGVECGPSRVGRFGAAVAALQVPVDAARGAQPGTVGSAQPLVVERQQRRFTNERIEIELPVLDDERVGVDHGLLVELVDVDRVELSYGSLGGLVRDLRAMGATNILQSRSRRPLSRSAFKAARAAFLDGADRANEQIEILHFAAWKAN